MPRHYRRWVFPRAPDFERNAGVVLELYHRPFEGRPLRPNEYVLSADEQTSIQARCRCHPTLPPAQARAMRVEHEYERGGALQYLAAWDCPRAKLFGRCEPRTGIAAFDRLVDQVRTRPPYVTARRVFGIVDSGSSHRGDQTIQRLEGRYRNLRLIHVPIHASWLNQVDIYFAIVQRKILTPNDFANVGEIEAHVEAFQAAYEEAAQPSEGSSPALISRGS